MYQDGGGSVLIVGATGVVGRAALEIYESDDSWDVSVLSRKKPSSATAAKWLGADLEDMDALTHALIGAGPFTHIVYAALQEEAALVDGWTSVSQISRNAGMLQNLLEALSVCGLRFSHLTLLQGTKAYGVHHGPYKMPAKESDPRFIASNFYYDQEDIALAKAKEHGFHITILRPQIVCGFALGNPMNAVTAIGVYGAICRELDQPFRFPGGHTCLQEAVDARLLGRAIKWAGSETLCRGETYNIANGDCFSWPTLWPEFARQLGVEAGIAHSFSLAEVMSDKQPVWDKIVRKHALVPHTYDEIVSSWQFMDYLLRHGKAYPHHSIVSTIKARKHGFHDCVDTEEMFRTLFAELQSSKILPAR
ncbi:nucleoside-diphosphate-sugar epimerase [Pararhizobium capsulatum DSM 1112]|uniref:Nucleoside-diphosphate-sugar epimerase n=1 Tax=Pararhizobium capsulatum DSM 1112 TaxID=1121113 RepID=A0ABU0BZ88_9HYPH|nr:nucleoside-diphosphate-sugar epimerase [Pararhizobium capsulatum DSM 1112]